MSQTILRTPARPGGAEAKRLDLIMAANVQTALATKVQELSGLFRKKQTAYLRRKYHLSAVRFDINADSVTDFATRRTQRPRDKSLRALKGSTTRPACCSSRR